MFYADSLGLDTVLEKLEALHLLTGDDCWRPTPLLADLTANGQTLASLNL